MTLELSKVSTQVASMGQSAARRADERSRATPHVLDLLSLYRDEADLREKVERAKRTKQWSGALPLTEPLDSAIDPPALPERVTLVAADGSQIYPDRHAIALYYVINIGSIILRLGTGETPVTETRPAIAFDDEHLYGDDDYTVSGPVINARRTVAEMTCLAQLAIQESAHAPTVALADGNIALRVRQEGISEDERARLEKEYMTQLDRLRAARIPAGGFIARPGATSIVRMLQLAEECPLDRVAEFVKNNKGRPYDGISDIPIFAKLLGAGQRSAVFQSATQWSAPYEARGHAICFFYLNVSTSVRRSIARVEVPEWIANDMDRVGLLHAASVAQCRVTSNPYPYVLTRADELAVITTAEKANFDQMIGVELMRHGVEALPSEKAVMKSVARYTRKR